MNPRLTLLLYSFLILAVEAWADGPADNSSEKVRRVPPPGITLSDADRSELLAGVQELGARIEGLRTELKGRPSLLELLPDVQVYHKAVQWAVVYGEIFKTNEVVNARRLLKRGLERAEELSQRNPSWISATGLVVRGFVSRIDGSVQPYGLVVPASFRPNSPVPFRLDVWFHGRGETLTELDFISGRERSPGEFTPPNAFVLHSYGRYCNGNKFAGETDVFESLEHARKYYPIDENRLVVRGFSLGGAACWCITPDSGPRPRRARASPRRLTSSKCSRRKSSSPPGTNRNCGISMIPRIGRSTSCIVRPWPTAARSTARNRRRT
jgi:hypothetical protein